MATTMNMRMSGLTLATVINIYFVALGHCENVVLNKPTYMGPGTNNENSEQILDGDSETFGLTNMWLVVDLGRDYFVEDALTDYFSYGWANVNIEVFIANPVIFPWSMAKQCAQKPQEDSHTRHTMSLACPPGLYGRYVRLRRQNINHPYFKVYEMVVNGHITDDFCGTPKTVETVSGHRLVTSHAPILLFVLGRLHCVSQCFREPECQGFNYNHATKACEMLLASEMNTNITSQAEWQINYVTYYTIV